jgi:CubicO group peptidase (beta-lactamase class C family)
VAGLDDVVRREMARWTVPGVAVGIQQGTERETHAWGVTSLETGYPLLPESVFRVASVSKLFTATLAMTLVDEGTLDLDRPAAEYLPELRLGDAEAQRVITTRHLLSHQSGLWGDFSEDHGLGEDALMRAVARFGTVRQITRPGELWAYCNVGFHLTGAIIQRIAGVPFETAMRERIFAPLGLRRTGFFAHEAIIHSAAVGHDPVTPGTDEHRVAGQYYPRNRNPAGGIISCVDDLLTFAALYLDGGMAQGGRVLSEAAIEAMWTPQIAAGNFADAYGIGFALADVGGVRTVGHGGSINGYQSKLTLAPDQGFAFVALTNSGRGSSAIRGIEREALAERCGAQHEEPPLVTLADADLARYAGTYTQPNTEIAVAVDGRGLRVSATTVEPQSGQRTALPVIPLRPLGDHRFIVTGGESQGARIEFIMGESEKPRFMRVGGRFADFRGMEAVNTAAGPAGNASGG